MQFFNWIYARLTISEWYLYDGSEEKLHSTLGSLIADQKPVGIKFIKKTESSYRVFPIKSFLTPFYFPIKVNLKAFACNDSEGDHTKIKVYTHLRPEVPMIISIVIGIVVVYTMAQHKMPPVWITSFFILLPVLLNVMARIQERKLIKKIKEKIILFPFKDGESA